MTGYKILDENMISFVAKMQYDLDVEYSVNDEISLEGDKGFHFCTDIKEALKWHPDKWSTNFRLFEVDTLDGEVIEGLYSCVSNKIKLVRELDSKEILKRVINSL